MGGRRSKRSTRCIGCRMHLKLCICSFIPSKATRHRWVFVQHPDEKHKTTNTGHLAHRGLAGSQLSWFWSRTSPPEPPLSWGSDSETVLLFPRQGDSPIAAADLAERPGPLTIVVLDGTWRQARKMATSIPQLQGMPSVALPPEAHARFSLREETFPGGMSTLDAVCWLAEAIETPGLGEELLQLNRVLVERTLATRGTPLPGATGLGMESMEG
ncbi:MAG: tRNA-uridine aminocarboxypropyltransferase [Myxococcota bacterium]|nr:tRNA-uridine aminocarboxypropyltransferase [Myxococcota bacterium]